MLWGRGNLDDFSDFLATLVPGDLLFDRGDLAALRDLLLCRGDLAALGDLLSNPPFVFVLKCKVIQQKSFEAVGKKNNTF